MTASSTSNFSNMSFVFKCRFHASNKQKKDSYLYVNCHWAKNIKRNWWLCISFVLLAGFQCFFALRRSVTWTHLPSGQSSKTSSGEFSDWISSEISWDNLFWLVTLSAQVFFSISFFPCVSVLPHCAVLTVAALIKEAESCRWGCYEEVSKTAAFQTSKAKARRMSSIHFQLTVIQAEEFHWYNLNTSVDLLESSAKLKLLHPTQTDALASLGLLLTHCVQQMI